MLSTREATLHDRNAIRSIYYAAFDKKEKDCVAKLAIDLLNLKTSPNTFSLVAERDHKLIGHIGLSPLYFESDITLTAYILAPAAVMPDMQKQGIGSKLIESAIETLMKEGVNLLFVYGDPKYYGRFGFNADNALNFMPPYDLEYSFGWMVRVLNETDVSSQQPLKLTCVTPLNDPALW